VNSEEVEKAFFDAYSTGLGVLRVSHVSRQEIELVTYEQLATELEARKCPSCGGLGTKDDAEPGDIAFRAWKCLPCKGTGLKKCDGQHAGPIREIT
jgi:hypothetical protein